MRIDANIKNHNPIPLVPLHELLDKLSNKTHALIYLKANYTDGSHCEHGWVNWRKGGLFTDPFDGTYFFVNNLDLKTSTARLLQPEEILNIHYCGE